METTFKLTGAKAVAALVAVAVIAVGQFAFRNQTLQTEAAEAVKTHVAAEYVRDALPEMQSASVSGTLTEERAEELVEGMSADNIEIMSIRALGRKGRYTARVEMRVGDSQPMVRYFRMRHSMATGWRVQTETGAINYYLSF